MVFEQTTERLSAQKRELLSAQTRSFVRADSRAVVSLAGPAELIREKKYIFYANTVLWDRVHARLLGSVYVWVWLLKLKAKIAMSSLAVIAAI